MSEARKSLLLARAIAALEGVGEGLTENPCFCGTDWIEASDDHPTDDDYEHAAWCEEARAVLTDLREAVNG